MKYDLEDLKVQSFVTSLNDEEEANVRGGGFTEGSCISRYIRCPGTAGCDCSIVCTEFPNAC